MKPKFKVGQQVWFRPGGNELCDSQLVTITDIQVNFKNVYLIFFDNKEFIALEQFLYPISFPSLSLWRKLNAQI